MRPPAAGRTAQVKMDGERIDLRILVYISGALLDSARPERKRFCQALAQSAESTANKRVAVLLVRVNHLVLPQRTLGSSSTDPVLLSPPKPSHSYAVYPEGEAFAVSDADAVLLLPEVRWGQVAEPGGLCDAASPLALHLRDLAEEMARGPGRALFAWVLLPQVSKGRQRRPTEGGSLVTAETSPPPPQQEGRSGRKRRRRVDERTATGPLPAGEQAPRPPVELPEAPGEQASAARRPGHAECGPVSPQSRRELAHVVQEARVMSVVVDACPPLLRPSTAWAAAR